MSRTTWIQVFVFLHVLGAITAVGPTLTYGLWLAQGDRAGPQMRAFVLRTTSWVDRHLATPSFVLQAFTGMALVLLLRISFFDTHWLLAGVAIYVVTVVFAMVVYAPTVRRQNDLADRVAADPNDAASASEYEAVARRARTFGILTIVLTLAIVFFMVVKPSL